MLPAECSRAAGPRDVDLHLSASIQDVMVQDLRAQPEHSLVRCAVLRPSCCAVLHPFQALVDPLHLHPSLV